MHPCREHAIRQSCNIIFFNSFSLFISIPQKVFRNTLDEWQEIIYTRSVRKVSGLPLYLRAGIILHHRADGILQSNPHLIENEALFSTIVLSSNRCPLSGFLSFGNSQKSQGAMSGLYGGWRSNAILCLLRHCCTRFDECAGALSW